VIGRKKEGGAEGGRTKHFVIKQQRNKNAVSGTGRTSVAGGERGRNSVFNAEKRGSNLDCFAGRPSRPHAKGSGFVACGKKGAEGSKVNLIPKQYKEGGLKIRIKIGTAEICHWETHSLGAPEGKGERTRF